MNRKLVFFLIGDSISMHYWPFLVDFVSPIWTPKRKEGGEASTVDLDIPQGANGGDSGMVLRYLESDTIDFRPDLMLVNCGLHDIKRYPGEEGCRVDPETYEQNLHGIAAFCDAGGIPLVWIRSTPVIDDVHNTRQRDFLRFSRDLDRYNTIADGVMNSLHVPSIDLYRFTDALGDRELFCDHVHFVPEVRRLQAAYIAGRLEGYAADPGASAGTVVR